MVALAHSNLCTQSVPGGSKFSHAPSLECRCSEVKVTARQCVGCGGCHCVTQLKLGAFMHSIFNLLCVRTSPQLLASGGSPYIEE